MVTIAKLKELLSIYPDNTKVFIYDEDKGNYLGIESISVNLDSIGKIKDIDLVIDSNV